MKPVLKHPYNGGTTLISFEQKELEFYRNAIKEFNDNKFVVVKKPSPDQHGIIPDTQKDFFSLHYLGEFSNDAIPSFFSFLKTVRPQKYTVINKNGMKRIEVVNIKKYVASRRIKVIAIFPGWPEEINI